MSFFSWLFPKKKVEQVVAPKIQEPIVDQAPDKFVIKKPEPVVVPELKIVPTREEMMSIFLGMANGNIATRVGAYKDVRESDGPNRSKAIDAIITAQGGKLGDSYCQYGQQECLDEICRYYEIVRKTVKIPEGGSTQSVFHSTDKKYVFSDPLPMRWITWKHGNTGLGHVGICLSAIVNGIIKTFEFNTSGGVGVSRNGDGAYFRDRSSKGSSDMTIIGFVDVYQAVVDAMIQSGKYKG